WRSQEVAILAFTTLLILSPLVPNLYVGFRETFRNLYAGQFAIIEFGLLAAVWGWLIPVGGKQKAVGRKGSREGILPTAYCLLPTDVLVGLALAALITKPQVMGLPVLLILLWALSRRRLAIPISAAVSLALLLLVPALLYPGSLASWLNVVFGSRGQAYSQVGVSASVWGVSYQWLGDGTLWVAVAGFLTIVGLLLLLPWWRRDLRDRTSPVPLALPLTLCMNSVISPYMLG